MIDKIGIIGDGQLGRRLFKSFKKYYNQGTVRLYSRKYGFDLLDSSILYEIINENSIIINCAALTDVNYCEHNRDEAFFLNSTIPAIIASLIGKKNLSNQNYTKTKFIHFSTDYVYGNSKQVGSLILQNSETDFCKPCNIYGETKLAGDNNILQNSAIQDYTLILRPSWLYDSDGERSIIFRIYESLKNKNEVTAVDDMYGIPTSCETIFNVIMLFIKNKIDPGLYNIRNIDDSENDVPSVYDVSKFIAQTLNVPVERIKKLKSSDFKVDAERQLNSMLNIDKLLNQLKKLHETEFLFDKKPVSFSTYISTIIPTWKESLKSFIEYRKRIETPRVEK